MQYVFLVMAMLACTGHGRRVQSPESLTKGEADLATLLLALNPSAAFNPGLSGMRAPAGDAAIHSTRQSTPEMFFLNANSEEGKQRRDALALRDAPPGSRMVTLRKPNSVANAKALGIRFRDSWGRAVYIDKILPGSEAERFKKQGKMKEGDEVVMVSATFGDEMWSARGIGVSRLENSIKCRQGAYISLVLSNPNEDRNKALQGDAEKEAKRMNRLQNMLQKEVDEETAKGGWTIR